jgi:endonuclease/exonuclease/phosphatase family metal-dependent hydrolase
MTFNVRYDTPEDGVHDWAGRRDAVAATVRFHRPDVVGFQEPLAHQLSDLRERLPGYRVVGRGRGETPSDGEHAPVGFRTDRFALDERTTFWLSETPDEPGSVGWDADLPRVATCVRLRDRETGTALWHCNTHLDHQGERARLEGARLLARRLPELRGGNDALLTGDFNCETGDPPHRALIGDDTSLRDARAASSFPTHGPETTRTDFESLVPDRAIDHVLVTPGVGVEQVGTCTDVDADGTFPSDHLPVVAHLSVGESD